MSPGMLIEEFLADPDAAPAADETELDEPPVALAIHDAIIELRKHLPVGAALYGVDRTFFAGETPEEIDESLARVGKKAEYFREEIGRLLHSLTNQKYTVATR